MIGNRVIFFLANRISSLVGSGSGRVMVRIAMSTIAVSVAVMVVSLFVITGFQNEITSKVVGFANHLSITSLSGKDILPLSADALYVNEVKKLDFVESIEPVTNKTGIIKNQQGVRGAVLKGVTKDYNFEFLYSSLVEGRLPNILSDQKSKEVLISQRISSDMKISLGDKFEMMFISGTQVYRDRLEVVGIYSTSLAEFDEVSVIGDIKVASRVSGFSEGEVERFEIIIDDFSKLDSYHAQVEDVVFEFVSDDEPVCIVPITEDYIAIFDWLSLQNTNIWIVLVVMVFVSAFSMIAMMLIILLDKSSMIGILKSMGMNNSTLQRLFLWRSSFIIVKGVVTGASLALVLCLIQDRFKVLTLPADGYFIDYVPIEINYIYLCAVMVYSVVALLLLQTLPVRVISKMSPHDSIKYS
ncbi:MAG: ABC transporter permease [Rikenellaceae bacterium]